MNKQSNVYTIIYASVMVIVVAAVLAYTCLLYTSDAADE